MAGLRAARGRSAHPGYSNLQVFTDEQNDGFDVGIMWRTSVLYDKDGAPGTWHWIEKA